MSPLSILIHLRLVDLPLLQQRFDDCLFKFLFARTVFYYLHFILSRFFHVTLLQNCGQKHLKRNQKQLDAITIYSKLKNTFTENYRMFKKSSMEHLTLHRNQAIKLQCKLVDLFLIYMSLHRKGLLDSPEYKKKHLYKTHK